MVNNYTFRPSAIDKTTTLTLEDEGIKIEKEGADTRTIAYQDIDSVNPKYMGSKNFPNMYHTVVTTRSGQKLVIKNHDYKGVLNMDDISKEYTPFVLSLHMAAQQKNNQINFRKGYKPVPYWLSMIVLMISMAVVGIAGILFMVGGMYIYGVIALLSTYFIYRNMAKFKKGNKPENYSVDNVPEGLLPGVG